MRREVLLVEQMIQTVAIGRKVSLSRSWQPNGSAQTLCCGARAESAVEVSMRRVDGNGAGRPLEQKVIPDLGAYLTTQGRIAELAHLVE